MVAKPKMAIDACVLFCIGSAVWVVKKKDSDRLDMRVAVTKDKERIKEHYKKQKDNSKRQIKNS